MAIMFIILKLPPYDGRVTTDVDVTVTVFDTAPLDGVFRIVGDVTDGLGQSLHATPDLNSGGHEDLFIGKYFRSYPGPSLASILYVLYREPFTSEAPDGVFIS